MSSIPYGAFAGRSLCEDDQIDGVFTTTTSFVTRSPTPRPNHSYGIGFPSSGNAPYMSLDEIQYEIDAQEMDRQMAERFSSMNLQGQAGSRRHETALLDGATRRSIADANHVGANSRRLIQPAGDRTGDSERRETFNSRASSVDDRHGLVRIQGYERRSNQPDLSFRGYDDDRGNYDRGRTHDTSRANRYGDDRYGDHRSSHHSRTRDSRGLVRFEPSLDERRDRHRDSGRSLRDIEVADRHEAYGRGYDNGRDNDYARRNTQSRGRDGYSWREGVRSESHLGQRSRYGHGGDSRDSRDSETRERNDLVHAAERIATRDARRYASCLTRH